jgi:hypothetical protein
MTIKHKINRLIKTGKFTVITINKDQFAANKKYLTGEYIEIHKDGIILYNNHRLVLYKVIWAIQSAFWDTFYRW